MTAFIHYQLAKSDGTQETLLGMGCTVLHEKSPLSVLEELLKGYPEDFVGNLGSILIESFRIVLDFWRGLDIPVCFRILVVKVERV